MKLRNKKTGEIYCCRNFYVDDTEDRKARSYDKLADLCNDWEDYEYVEPLIKDEKIRKAVRAWAEANEFGSDYKVKYWSKAFSLMSWQADVEFNHPIKDLEDEMDYTIDELCGEEE